MGFQILCTRRLEREEELNQRLARENARRAALNLEPLPDTEALEDVDEPDVQLDQAAAIITDLAEMRELETLPAQKAARVQQ